MKIILVILLMLAVEDRSLIQASNVKGKRVHNMEEKKSSSHHYKQHRQQRLLQHLQSEQREQKSIGKRRKKRTAENPNLKARSMKKLSRKSSKTGTIDNHAVASLMNSINNLLKPSTYDETMAGRHFGRERLNDKNNDAPFGRERIDSHNINDGGFFGGKKIRGGKVYKKRFKQSYESSSSKKQKKSNSKNGKVYYSYHYVPAPCYDNPIHPLLGCDRGRSENEKPTVAPSYMPSDMPSDKPSDMPSEAPSSQPSDKPSTTPSDTPSSRPTMVPTATPTIKTFVPSDSGTVPTITFSPSFVPSDEVTGPTSFPTLPLPFKRLRLEEYYVAYNATIINNVPPTQEQYDEVLAATDEYLNDYYTNYYKNNDRVTFERVETTLNETEFNAGIPDDDFNIYMEYNTAFIYSLDSDLPDEEEVFSITKSLLESSNYYVNYLWNLANSPFAFTNNVVMDKISILNNTTTATNTTDLKRGSKNIFYKNPDKLSDAQYYGQYVGQMIKQSIQEAVQQLGSDMDNKIRRKQPR